MWSCLVAHVLTCLHPDNPQVMAYSATFTPQLLADLQPLMKKPHTIITSPDTVSLAGVRQFYLLVPAASQQQQQQAQSLPSATAATASGTTLVSADPAAAMLPTPATAAAAAHAGESDTSTSQELFALKVDSLLQLLNRLSFHQAVVFCNTKPRSQWLAQALTASGFPADYLAGDLPQPERMAVMTAVRDFKLRVR